MFLNNCTQLTERKTIIVVERSVVDKTLEKKERERRNVRETIYNIIRYPYNIQGVPCSSLFFLLAMNLYGINYSNIQIIKYINT